MPHSTPLIAILASGFGLALVFGLVAQRLKLSPLVGYLVAGIIIGPLTPGYVADQHLATELAEIGVILLMFGVGLHFSLKDLLSVKAIAIQGALGQIAVATLLGIGLAWLLGWSFGAGLIFGLALSVASTVVLLRALQERRIVDSERGRIAVGWLIVEDLVMVLTLVVIPPLAGLLDGVEQSSGLDIGWTSGLGLNTVGATLLVTALEVGLFILLMLVFGRWLIPMIMHYVAHTGSRELFRLAVLAIAIGVAHGSAQLFGASFALRAFFAGMVLAESQLSHQAAKETLPLRDAFAILFFVSVGMLFNPVVLVEQPLVVLATFAIILLGKFAAAYLIVPDTVRDLVVAGAILSIIVNPPLCILLDRLSPAGVVVPPAAEAPLDRVARQTPTLLSGHAVLIGHGRVGSKVSGALMARNVPLVIVEDEPSAIVDLKAQGIETFVGAAGEQGMLERLNLAQAKWLIVAVPDPFEA